MTSPSLLCWQKVSQGSMSGLLLRWKILSERCVCVCVSVCVRAWTCVSLPIPNSCLLYNNELKVLELGSSRSLCGMMSLLCYKSIHCTTYTSIHVPPYTDSFAPKAVLRMSSVRLSPACSCGRTRKASRN